MRVDEHWQIGATLDAKSGAPITAFGVGNPYDATAYHSYFICVANCTFGRFDTACLRSIRVAEAPAACHGSLILELAFPMSARFGAANFKAKLAFFNLLNKAAPGLGISGIGARNR